MSLGAEDPRPIELPANYSLRAGLIMAKCVRVRIVYSGPHCHILLTQLNTRHNRRTTYAHTTQMEALTPNLAAENSPGWKIHAAGRKRVGRWHIRWEPELYFGIDRSRRGRETPLVTIGTIWRQTNIERVLSLPDSKPEVRYLLRAQQKCWEGAQHVLWRPLGEVRGTFSRETDHESLLKQCFHHTEACAVVFSSF